MTEPLFESSGPVERPGGGGLAGAIGPEAVAALLAIVVVVALVGARFVAIGGGTAIVTPQPSSATDAPSRTAPIIDVGAIQALLVVNRNLADIGVGLEGELKAPPLDTQAVRNDFGNMKPQLDSGQIQAERLQQTPAGASVAADLIAVYSELDAIRSGTTGLLLTSQGEFTKATAAAIKAIAKLPALNDQLMALLAGGTGPTPSSAPSGGPSVAPSPSALPSPTPSATPVLTPPPTAPPSAPPSVPASAPPSGIPTAPPGPNQVQNPGFEDGVLLPWNVAVGQTAEATLSSDPANPHSGKASARIDIIDPGLARGSISLQQQGLSIQAGAYYQVSVALRAAAARDVLILITSPGGQPLGTGQHVAQISPDWAVATFQMTSIIPSDTAIIAIDVGGNPVTVWVDDVSFTRINSGSP